MQQTDSKKNAKHNYKSLATDIYEITYRSLEKQLAPFKKKLEDLATPTIYARKVGNKYKRGKGKSRWLNQKQLQFIVDEIGQPPSHTFNGKKFVLDKD